MEASEVATRASVAILDGLVECRRQGQHWMCTRRQGVWGGCSGVLVGPSVLRKGVKACVLKSSGGFQGYKPVLRHAFAMTCFCVPCSQA